jgi:hypothetical protein
MVKSSGPFNESGKLMFRAVSDCLEFVHMGFSQTGPLVERGQIPFDPDRIACRHCRFDGRLALVFDRRDKVAARQTLGESRRPFDSGAVS